MEGAWKGGLAVKPAAEVAIDYVNRHKNILPGYRLNMKWRNTKVSLYIYTYIMTVIVNAAPTQVSLNH